MALASLFFFFSVLSCGVAQPTLKVQVEDHEQLQPRHPDLAFAASLSASSKDGSLLQVRIPTGNTFQLKAEPIESRFIKSVGWSRSGGVYS